MLIESFPQAIVVHTTIRCDERGELFICRESIEAIAQRVAELLEEHKLETKP